VPHASPAAAAAAARAFVRAAAGVSALAWVQRPVGAPSTLLGELRATPADAAALAADLRAAGGLVAPWPDGRARYAFADAREIDGARDMRGVAAHLERAAAEAAAAGGAAAGGRGGGGAAADVGGEGGEAGGGAADEGGAGRQREL